VDKQLYVLGLIELNKVTSYSKIQYSDKL